MKNGYVVLSATILTLTLLLIDTLHELSDRAAPTNDLIRELFLEKPRVILRSDGADDFSDPRIEAEMSADQWCEPGRAREHFPFQMRRRVV